MHGTRMLLVVIPVSHVLLATAVTAAADCWCQLQLLLLLQLWQAPPYSELAPRVSLVAGDMFDAATIPAPPAAGGKHAYTLRNILHDWPEADCVRILAAIRARISAADVAAKRVDLLLVEVTTAEEVLPCHLPFRCVTTASRS